MAFNQIDTDDEVTEKDGLLLNNTHPNKQPDNNPESPGNNPDSITKWERVTAAFRKRLKKDGLRLILLIVLNGFYLYFGGLIFYMLERKPRVVVDEKDHVGMLIDTFKVCFVSNPLKYTRRKFLPGAKWWVKSVWSNTRVS